jgi:hypothetical protein
MPDYDDGCGTSCSAPSAHAGADLLVSLERWTKANCSGTCQVPNDAALCYMLEPRAGSGVVQC